MREPGKQEEAKQGDFRPRSSLDLNPQMSSGVETTPESSIRLRKETELPTHQQLASGHERTLECGHPDTSLSLRVGEVVPVAQGQASAEPLELPWKSASTQMLGKGVHGNVKGTQRHLSGGPAPSATTGLGDLGQDGEWGICHEHLLLHDLILPS